MSLPYRGNGRVFLSDTDLRCALYFSENERGVVIKIYMENQDGLGDFLALPLNFPYLCGKLESGLKFTLINLEQIHVQDFIGNRTTVFTYGAKCLLEGISNSENHEPLFHKIAYTLSDVIDWGGRSLFSLNDDRALCIKDDPIEETLYENNEYKIDYCVYGTPVILKSDLRDDELILRQSGNIIVSFTQAVSFKTIDKSFERLKKLLDFALFRQVEISSIGAFSSSIIDQYGETEIERRLEVRGMSVEKNSADEPHHSRRFKEIGLPDLIDHNSFSLYFTKQEDLAPIFELYLELLYANSMSSVRAFLNIAQALETYHARFCTNSLSEIKKRIEEFIAPFPDEQREAIRTVIMPKEKRKITLKTRISDLLISNISYRFDTGDISYFKFPTIVAHTRNYYIHYNEKIKERHRVFSKKELSFYTRTLIEILEHYILMELGFSEKEWAQKNKKFPRWGKVSEDLRLARMSQEKRPTTITGQTTVDSTATCETT